MSNPDAHPPGRTGFRLSQESVVVITAAVALAGLMVALGGLMLTITADIREEGRADRAAWQAESRHLREQARAERTAMAERTQAALDALGARGEADRETFEAQMQKLQEQVVGLSTRQAALVAAAQASQ